jgi:hypothetical protein
MNKAGARGISDVLNALNVWNGMNFAVAWLELVFVVRDRVRSDFTVTFHGHDHDECAPRL